MALTGSTYEGGETSMPTGGDAGTSYLSMTGGDSLFSGSYAPFSKGTYQCGGKKKRRRKTNRKLKKSKKRNTKKRKSMKKRKRRQRGGDGCSLNSRPL